MPMSRLVPCVPGIVAFRDKDSEPNIFYCFVQVSKKLGNSKIRPKHEIMQSFARIKFLFPACIQCHRYVRMIITKAKIFAHIVAVIILKSLFFSYNEVYQYQKVMFNYMKFLCKSIRK